MRIGLLNLTLSTLIETTKKDVVEEAALIYKGEK